MLFRKPGLPRLANSSPSSRGSADICSSHLVAEAIPRASWAWSIRRISSSCRNPRTPRGLRTRNPKKIANLVSPRLPLGPYLKEILRHHFVVSPPGIA